MTPAQDILSKAILPTHLDSAAIREQIASEIRRRSIFSATTVQADYLTRMQQVLSEVSSGTMDDATARKMLQDFLDSTGYVADNPQSITDLGSKLRLDLIINTQREMAANVARIQGQTQQDLDLYPAWELVPMGIRRKPRTDWPMRWSAAGNSVGWDGAVKSRMMARKDSPIWVALGDGTGGYDDAIGNPYPPFAFNSSHAWLAISREEASASGLQVDDMTRPDVTLSPGEQEIKDAIKNLGPEFEADLLKELQ
jgi:hypothetical protein